MWICAFNRYDVLAHLEAAFTYTLLLVLVAKLHKQWSPSTSARVLTASRSNSLLDVSPTKAHSNAGLFAMS